MKLYIYVGFITAAISILIYFIDPRNIETIFALNTLRGYIGAITVPIFWSFIGDADDFGAWKFKRRMSGVYGVLGIFRPKTTKCSGGPAVCGLQRGITFFEIPIWALFE
ncbi:hypothetical protein OLZ09_24640 [Escherichia coli]|uniref:hypothetical protein n=1 Tax=Escherichia coli TaxID=562 RepID=UPI0022652A70|nr:hypothetical protein [Escherichia coli]MCX8224400.1 hypothetical protein [Escherichia coli]MCX8276433.1 hypothetical protein [Escherichia coli]